MRRMQHEHYPQGGHCSNSPSRPVLAIILAVVDIVVTGNLDVA